jgi:hypothetical protein
MRKPFEETSDPRRPSGDTPAAKSKKVYRTPRLVTYGNLRDLSLGTGGGKADGLGAPKSRA